MVEADYVLDADAHLSDIVSVPDAIQFCLEIAKLICSCYGPFSILIKHIELFS